MQMLRRFFILISAFVVLVQLVAPWSQAQDGRPMFGRERASEETRRRSEEEKTRRTEERLSDEKRDEERKPVTRADEAYGKLDPTKHYNADPRSLENLLAKIEADTQRRPEKNKTDKRGSTHADDAAKDIDLSKSDHTEKLDFNALNEKVKTDEGLKKTSIETQSDATHKVEKTLDRIKRGEMDAHENDGTIFRNREQLLPKHDAEYYREYVYRPDGAESVGAERVIVGRDGDVYYTPDHYKSFQRIR